MRHSGFLRRLPDATRDFVDDHVVVRGVSAQQTSEANNGVVFFGFGKGTCSRGDFEGTWNTDNFDVFFSRLGAYESVVGAPQQTVSDELVESRHHNRET